jgi:hypothetical protein
MNTPSQPVLVAPFLTREESGRSEDRRGTASKLRQKLVTQGCAILGVT